MREFAEKLVKEAGIILRKNFHSIKEIETKAKHDFVTNVDKESENTIISMIKEKYPEHGIIAEESGKRHGDEYTWIIDPLDGTTNFIHCIPFFNVSIGLRFENKIILGVVYNPILDEMFVAEKGKGAFLNNKPISVSKTEKIEDAFLGFCHAPDDESIRKAIEEFSALKPIVQDVRKFGAAALELCYVACGRLDGFFSNGTKVWDVQAGCLIVQEAGGIVTDYLGKRITVDKNNVIASNSKIHKRILELLTNKTMR